MFNIDRKTVLIILGVMVLVNVLLGQRSIEGIIISLPGVIVAMTCTCMGGYKTWR